MALQPYMPALQGSLGIRRPRNKYRNVAESYLFYCKKRKRRASRTRMFKRRMIKLLEKLLCQRGGIHSEYGALLRYTQDYQKRPILSSQVNDFIPDPYVEVVSSVAQPGLVCGAD